MNKLSLSIIGAALSFIAIQTIRLNINKSKVDNLREEIVLWQIKDSLNQSQIVTLNKEVMFYEDKSFRDSLNFVGQIGQLQMTIQKLTKSGRDKDIKIENLQKGVRVDLVTLRYRNQVFGKDRLIDSTYIVGHKWGY